MSNERYYDTEKEFTRNPRLIVKLSENRLQLYFKGISANQLVSYTRQMDLVHIGDQAKLENASLRTKYFNLEYEKFSAYRTPIDYRISSVITLSIERHKKSIIQNLPEKY